eukprot:2658560-Amphidinium_carterae.1
MCFETLGLGRGGGRSSVSKSPKIGGGANGFGREPVGIPPLSSVRILSLAHVLAFGDAQW